MIQMKLLHVFRAVWEFIKSNLLFILFEPKVSNSFQSKNGNNELFLNSSLIFLVRGNPGLSKKVCPFYTGIILLLKFIFYAKRDYNQFLHNANTCCYYGRWEFSRLFC
jgi:hypothetical protein